MTDGSRLADNLEHIRARIVEAARRSGRMAADVRLVAVTKYVDVDVTRELIAAGCRALGESRPQELWRKAQAFVNESLEWHLIGHLQRNKVARTLPLIRLLHAGDSLRLIEAVNEEAARTTNEPVPLLLEVNVSGDPSKHGFQPDELEPLGERLAALARVRIDGLMCMAAREGDLDRTRRDFERLRQLRDQLRAVWPGQLALDELSMGMSGDFEVAIEEGATIVRVGSSLFEGVVP
ncbi:MAG TPA: YggS family pyridoxal phosphate-dependent enzyme [Pirellulales bacterium]|nr:YggS family pyridoxal phosphate-dependent enzyme [Pirellulales bacterium]